MLLIIQRSGMERELGVNSEGTDNSEPFFPSLIPARMAVKAPAVSFLLVGLD